MKSITIVLFFISITRIAIAAPEMDSGIHGPTYDKLLAETNSWAIENPETLKIIDYGKSVEGRQLRLLILMKDMELSDRPTFLMSGSTHGNEYLEIEMELPKRLIKKQNDSGIVQEYLNRGGAIVFIPILNPDGYHHRRRENAKGKDLNRDWDIPKANFKGLTQPETKQLADILESLTYPPFNFRYRVTVDYHCCGGALLYPWAYTKSKLPEPDLSRHKNLAKEAETILSIKSGTTGEILGYYPMGSTKDYYYSKYGSLSFTFEGRHREENKYLNAHETWWETMLNSQWLNPQHFDFNLNEHWSFWKSPLFP